MHSYSINLRLKVVLLEVLEDQSMLIWIHGPLGLADLVLLLGVYG